MAGTGKGSSTTTRKTSLKGSQVMSLLEKRRKMVAEAAYYRAGKRGFSGGNELDDWLEAEKEIDRLMTGNE